jgi:hypothetical protein
MHNAEPPPTLCLRLAHIGSRRATVAKIRAHVTENYPVSNAAARTEEAVAERCASEAAEMLRSRQTCRGMVDQANSALIFAGPNKFIKPVLFCHRPRLIKRHGLRSAAPSSRKEPQSCAKMCALVLSCLLSKPQPHDLTAGTFVDSENTKMPKIGYKKFFEP